MLQDIEAEGDIWLVHGLIEAHWRATESALASRILDNWEHMLPMFVKVMPTDYKRVLQARRAAKRPPGGDRHLAVAEGGLK